MTTRSPAVTPRPVRTPANRAIADMPVHRVEARVQHPAGEPPVEGRIRAVQHRGGLGVPVDQLGSGPPVLVGPGQTLVVLLLVAAHGDAPSLPVSSVSHPVAWQLGY